ncbi:MAG: hypothetical protein N3D12_03955 [Candidatus Methanomethyliaceae archaeon]|nr:hypothetical protein [Candidatus Methanomethyliaceae archaeon]
MSINRSRTSLLSHIAVLGALSIIMSSIKVSFPLGNPNLGSTPVSLSAVLCGGYAGFLVGIIKGLGVSLWTGQAILEIPAGIGDGLMAVFTNALSKRIGPFYAILLGQISRYIFTSGMIALVLGTVATLSPNLLGAYAIFSKITSSAAYASPDWIPLLISNIGLVWVAMLPAITASVVANAALSAAVVLGLKKLAPSSLKKV